MTVASNLSMLTTAMRAAEAEWPKPVATAIADRERLTAAASAVEAGTHAELMAAAASALLDGADPLTDEEVVRLVVAKVLAGDAGQGLALGVAVTAESRVVAAIIDNAEDVLDGLKKGIDAAGAVLAAAYEVLGHSDLSDSASILKLGPAAATAWAEARAAVKTIRIADDAWYALANLGAAPTSGTPIQRLADVSLEQFDKWRNTSDVWEFVGAGIAIDYADRTTIKEREQRVNAERTERDTAGAIAFDEVAGRSLRFN